MEKHPICSNKKFKKLRIRVTRNVQSQYKGSRTKLGKGEKYAMFLKRKTYHDSTVKRESYVLKTTAAGLLLLATK